MCLYSYICINLYPMNLRCIAIDDEPLALDLLEDNIRQVPYLELVAKCTDAFEAIKVLQESPVDLIFLDIQMPEISGLDLARTIRGRTRVILTTAYSEFVSEGFELEVVDYLLKPVPFPRFLKAVQRVQQLLAAPAAPAAPAEDETGDDYFFVKTELKGKMLKINFRDIDYIESMKNYVAIHHNGAKTMALLTMKDLEDRLPIAHFIRIHRGFIIAIDKITAIEGNMVMLRNVKEGILLGDTYRPVFLEKMRGKILQ